MNSLVFIILLFVLSAEQYEFFCEYSACIVSNIHITYDGLYAFTFIPNGTDMLFLKAAKGRLADFSFVEAIPDLVQFVLEKCKFEELVLPAFRKSSSVVMKHVSVKTIRFHSADKMLHDFRLCGTTFNDIPYTVLQLQYVLNLEQSRSSIRQLHLSVLRNLKRLVNLNLSYNKIQTVTADPESLCCNQLQSLNLIGNSLMRFDFGILMYMPQFQRIFLGDNKIDTITTGRESRYTSRKNFCSWKSYYLKRMEVDFEIPKPPCVDYFAKLNRITLNRNKLTVIDTSLLEYMNLLNDLDLAHNPIKTVKINKDKVPILLNLSLLNGEAGYLHTLPPDVFTSD